MHIPADDVKPGSNCPNCGHELHTGSRFCALCGQKTGATRVSLKSLLGDFFDSVFNLNSRLFATISRLFIPGYLTREFFIGRQVRYMNPLRLFFVTLIGMYAVLGLTLFNQLESQVDAQARARTYQVNKQARILVTQAAYQLGYDSLDTQKQALLDSLISSVQHTEVDTSSGLQISLHRDSAVVLTPEEVYDLEIDSVYRKYALTSFWERLITRQLIRTQREPVKAFQFIIANTSWMILLLMPALAVCMKLLYFRRRFLVEHLVFLFHYHAAVFTTCIVYVPLLSYLPRWIALGVPIALLLFLYLAMKRYYRRSWIGTLMRLLLLAMSYVMILFLFVALTASISVIIFH